jgi:hypothetical protein
MRGKCAWVLALCGMCAVVVVLAWSRGPRQPQVTLTFVGFTNQLVPFRTSSGSGTLSMPMAVLKAENHGRSPVEATSMWRNQKTPLPTNVCESRVFLSSTNGQFPRVLRPGEAYEYLIFQATDDKEFCFSELNYFPQTNWRRFYNWAMGRGGPWLQSVMARVLPTPEGRWAGSGLIARSTPKWPGIMNGLPAATNRYTAFGSASGDSFFEEMRVLEERVKERLSELEKK